MIGGSPHFYGRERVDREHGPIIFTIYTGGTQRKTGKLRRNGRLRVVVVVVCFLLFSARALRRLSCITGRYGWWLPRHSMNPSAIRLTPATTTTHPRAQVTTASTPHRFPKDRRSPPSTQLQLPGALVGSTPLAPQTRCPLQPPTHLPRVLQQRHDHLGVSLQQLELAVGQAEREELARQHTSTRVLVSRPATQ